MLIHIDDDLLKDYIPLLGDRLATRSFCALMRGCSSSSSAPLLQRQNRKRKASLVEKIRASLARKESNDGNYFYSLIHIKFRVWGFWESLSSNLTSENKE